MLVASGANRKKQPVYQNVRHTPPPPKLERFRCIRKAVAVSQKQTPFMLALAGIVIGFGSMAWYTYADKRRHEMEARIVAEQAAAVARIPGAVIDLCAAYHSKVLMPRFHLPDPMLPENDFGRGASGLAFDAGLAKILAERGQPARESEMLRDSNGVPYAAVAERIWTDPARWKGEWVYVFVVVKASACGADLATLGLSETDSVFLDFNFTRFPDGTFGPRPNV